MQEKFEALVLPGWQWCAQVRVLAWWHTQQLLRGQTLRVLAVLWWGLLALATGAGVLAARAERSAHEAFTAAQPLQHAAWVEAYGDEPFRPVHVTAEHPLILHLGPAPGRALAVGAGDAVGHWAQPTGLHVRELEGRRGGVSAGGERLDLTALLVAAGALLALAVGHDALAGERERGTLALHAANGVGPRTLLSGKWLGVQAVVVLLLLLPLAVALVGMARLGALGPQAAGLACAYGSLAWLYMVAWSTVGLALSCWTRQAATALLAGVAVWVLVGVVAPRALATAAENRFPTPAPAATEQSLQGALNLARDGYRKQLEQARAQGGTLDARTMATLRQDYFTSYYRGADQVLQPLEAAQQGRRAWFQGWAWMSPSLSFQLAGAGLAGTDGDRHGAFRQAADRYARTLRQWLDARALAGETARPAWHEWPRLAFIDAGHSALGTPWNQAVLGLLLWTLGALALGYAGLQRVSWRAASDGRLF